MYTISDYFSFIEEQYTAFKSFLSKEDEGCISAITLAVATGNLIEISQLSDDDLRYDNLQNTINHLVKAEILDKTEEVSDLKPHSKIAEALLCYHYLQTFITTDAIEKFMLAFSEVNPHKNKLLNILNKINDHEYDEYFYITPTSDTDYLTFENTTCKIITADNSGADLEHLSRELVVNFFLKGKSNESICACSSFYIMPENDRKKDTDYSIIMFYRGTEVVIPDEADSSASNTRSLEELLMELEDQLELELPYMVDKEYFSAEPMILYTPNDKGETIPTVINYPYVTVSI